MIAKSFNRQLWIILLILSIATPSNSFAEDTKDTVEDSSSGIEHDDTFDYMLKNYKNQYYRQDQGPGAKRKDNNPNKAPDRYVYETPTVKALSHLFWAVNMYKVEDDEAIDEFMRINECNIYRTYNPDEVEWKKIRDATRNFLVENKNDFPTRFEFMLPLKLGDYIESKKSMKLQKEYEINNLRRFELVASDYRAAKKACVKDHNILKGYPRAIILEFSRPFNLTYFPVDRTQALDYIKEKITFMKKKYPPKVHTKKFSYKLRDAYLVIKVKIFTFGKFLGRGNLEINTVQMMGVLEGYEIYEDVGKEKLMYTQNYVARRKKGKLNDRLKSQYEIIIKRSKDRGILHP